MAAMAPQEGKKLILLSFLFVYSLYFLELIVKLFFLSILKLYKKPMKTQKQNW